MKSTHYQWERTFESTLSSNRIHLGLTDDNRLEVTLISHDGNETWGESLSAEDTGRFWVELEDQTGGWS